MVVSEINLPINSTIYEPQTKNLKKLTFEALKKKILESEIPNLIISSPTLVIVNDGHRSTPSHKIIDILLTIPNHKMEKIIIATGTHKPPTNKELFQIFRTHTNKLGVEVVIHDSQADNLIYKGTTERGTEIHLNPIVDEYEQILCINSVEPHFFAGFTGGVKSIIPGLAGKKTVEKNHSWALDPNTGPAKIEGNPLQTDLREALTFLNNMLLGIQILNIGDEIYDIICGDLNEVASEAIEKSKEIFCIKLSEPVDVVVSLVYPPLNRSLYQAQKGIENTRQILRKGGEMILVAECTNGIGNDLFYKTISRFNSPSDVISQLNRENYSFGDHKAVKFSTISLESTVRLIGNISEIECKRLFALKMEMESLEYHLRELSDKGKKIAIVLDSGVLAMTL
ncbi:MAG: hypothetical protein HeimC2_12700 [Candidatus Heimdallarchaeota archaeon LC_2]|nr:MAG: hypothetical protein HeimC2_12700 [Candidatus Heimdallarchaeota archaeon LC_2]